MQKRPSVKYKKKQDTKNIFKRVFSMTFPDQTKPGNFFNNF